MAINDSYKLDKVFKKTLGKTITTTVKNYYEEAIFSQPEIHSDDVWTDDINSSPAQAVLDGVAEFIQLTLTEDTSTSQQKAWLVCSTPGNPATRLTNFIPPRFGQSFEVRIFQDNGGGAEGAEIYTTQSPDGNPANGWFFDYKSGVLTLTAQPTAWTTPLHIRVYRYIGETGGGGAIKNTIAVSKLGSELVGSQGSHIFLKMHSVFLANASFVRVYKDDVLQTYLTNWAFNPAGQSNIGRVADLTDGVSIVAAVLTSTYRLEIDEYYLPITPTLMLWRNDGAGCRRQPVLYRINRGNPGDYGVLTIPIEELGTYSWRATYSDVPAPKVYSYGDRLGVGWWNKGQTLPTDWRIELYKIGKNTKAGGDSTYNIPQMDNTMTPTLQTSVNSINLTQAGIFMGSFGACRNGYYFVRLRNTATNTVTNFSTQRLRLQNRGVRNENHTINYGNYRKTGIC